MATKKDRKDNTGAAWATASASVDDLLLAAMERGGNTLETGRYIMTFKEGAAEEGIASLGARGQGMRVADAREFDDESVSFEAVGDADAVTFPEIGVALVGAGAVQERGLMAAEFESDSPVAVIEPEHFVFSDQYLNMAYTAQATEYAHSGNGGINLISLARILEVIAKETEGVGVGQSLRYDDEVDAAVLGATWGLNACRVPQSSRSGLGIKVAILDTGLDLGHPDFAGRTIVTNQFVGQPVQDLSGSGTHYTGTACGPKFPPGTTPQYGISFQTTIFVGKVLSNSGTGSQAGVLAGMNWAIANRCPVILATSGAAGPVNAAYTAAGQAALNNGCLIISGAGSNAGPAGVPSNSPTIMSVASLDQNLAPSSFSSFGKIDIAAPGRDIFSSWSRSVLYRTISGTVSAAAHVTGCAALWAQTSPALRGALLRKRLIATARPLPFPPARVGAGLVQAPA